MSRELKFRVWDNLKKEWISNKHIWRMRTDEHGVGEILPNTFYWKQHPDGLTYQQYTGLKDQNGVEIYEGDIIMFPLFENDNTVSYHYFQVIWDEFYSAWSFAKKDGKPLTHTGWKIYYSDTTEVIGNLFENPELLEQ